jgi:hypothetical protein
MEVLQCRHCQSNFTGKFCPECGQKYFETPYSWKFFINLLADGYDFGSIFFKTLFFLFARPKKVVQSFLMGDLKQFVTPIKFLISIVGLLFVFELLEKYVLENEPVSNWYLPYIVVSCLALYLSICNRIFFGKNNWLEHLLITFYQCSGCLLIFFIFGFVSDIIKFQSIIPQESNSWAGYMFGTILLYNLWFNLDVFRGNKLKIFLKTLTIDLITVVVVIFLFTII